MKEGKWTGIVCGQLKKFNASVTVIAGGNKFQEPGLPDRFIAHNKCGGAWVEFKGEKTPLEPKQRLKLKEFCDRGQPAFVNRFPGILQNYDGEELGRWETIPELLSLLSRESKSIRKPLS